MRAMFPLFREKVRTRGSRRGKKVRAKGLDGSPRNGEMSRTGMREGLKQKARRCGFSMVMGYWLLKREFDTLVGNGCVAAPERPNKKTMRKIDFCHFMIIIL
jgi:hypothetical protein